jgi:hypothetical protein
MKQQSWISYKKHQSLHTETAKVAQDGTRNDLVLLGRRVVWNLFTLKRWLRTPSTRRARSHGFRCRCRRTRTRASRAYRGDNLRFQNIHVLVASRYHMFRNSNAAACGVSLAGALMESFVETIVSHARDTRTERER